MADNNRKVLEQEDEAAVITALASYVSECATEAISDHGAFFIGLSGKFSTSSFLLFLLYYYFYFQ